MTDDYRIQSPDHHDALPVSVRRSDPLDTWLWIAIVVSLAANVTLSLAGHDILGIPCGIVVIGAGIALWVRHHGRQR